MDRDDAVRLEQIVQGISDGCIQADCALLGGETAIMPDLYQAGDYDLAGFCVGVVEQRSLINGKAIAVGDTLIGVASSGLHSNGYSLVRRIVFDIAGLDHEQHVEELGETVGEALLRPTRIYAQAVRAILQHYRVKSVVHGLAHITGGGLEENLGRILPEGTRAAIQPDSWEVPPVFPWLQRLGAVDGGEMERVFNMGIGLVLVVSPYYAESILRMLRERALDSWRIGEIVAAEGN
jgi:phosphoribosylformylglycinamidine cyclo-ligase